MQLGGVDVYVAVGALCGKTDHDFLSFSQGDSTHRMKAVFKTWLFGHVHDRVHFGCVVPGHHFYGNGFPPIGMRLVGNLRIVLSGLGGFQSESGRASGIT